MGRHEIFENAEPLLADQEGRRVANFSFSPPVSARQKARDRLSPGSQPDVMDLASVCIDQVKRLADWDAKPDSLSEAEGDAEMDRWGAVFQRAIDAPSADLRDLAGKAHLMLADLNRFYPAESHTSDNFRLMRVILAEAMAFGGLANLPSDASGLAPDDADLLALTESFDTAHSAWLVAARANDEPAERCNAHIKFAMACGVAPILSHEQAWALPGVMEANNLEESTYSALAEIAMKALSMRAQSLGGLALQARAVTPLIWLDGEYDKDASLAEGEDLGKEAVRRLVESVLALSKAGSANTSPSAGSDAGSSLGHSDLALWQAIDAHRRAHTALIDAAVAADRVRIRQEGGDTSAAAMAPLEAAAEVAGVTEIQAWREVFAVRPNTIEGLLRLLSHTSEHYEGNYGIHEAPDVFGALIGAVEGLRFAMQPQPAGHDLSLLSIADLEHLTRIAYHERKALLAVESQGFCWLSNRAEHSPVGRIVEAEGERMAFLGDYAVHEIERRRPVEKREVNLRLEALVRHQLNCKGYIEPELMTEVVQAWSAR